MQELLHERTTVTLYYFTCKFWNLAFSFCMVDTCA